MAIKQHTRKDGTKWLQIDFRDCDGKRVREFGGHTKTQAKNLLEQRRSEVRLGTYVNPRRAKQAAIEAIGPTFASYAEQFLRDYGSERRSDYYKQQLTNTGAIMRFFGKKRLREVTEADLDAFRRARAEEVGSGTVRKNLILLGTMFKQAKRWKLIPMNPAADVEKPAEPRHREQYFTVEEWHQLHDAAEPWLKPILLMTLAAGGPRLKEVVGLRWDNIDRRGGVIYFSSDNKSGKPRRVPLGKVAAGVLKEQTRRLQSPFVFTTSEGDDYTGQRQRNRVSQRTRAAARAAGIETGRVFHTLRHTVGSWLGQSGFTELHLAQLLGHADDGKSMTRRYVHLRADHLRPLVETLDKILLQDGHSSGHHGARVLVSP